MPKAVIFDVDGTLVDSVDLHAQGWVDALREFGHEIEFEDVRRQIGKGGDQLLPVFLSEKELSEKGKAIENRRSQLFSDRYLPRVGAFPNVRALFERLAADGKLVVLASSAKGEELKTYKRVADIEDLLHGETSSDDAEKSKPYPDIFAAAMRKLDGITAQETVVVGDTPYDAEAAAKAGLRTIGLTCGGWSEEALRQAGCIAVYRDPRDLLASYSRSPLKLDTMT